MKKKMLIIALIAICLAVCASGTYAYFVTELPTHNVITTNGVSIDLVEMQQDADGNETEFPTDTAVAVMPGSEVSKIVTVKALDAECWVRVMASFAFYDADGNEVTVSDAELADAIAIAASSAKWVYNEADGWIYYSEPLAEGDETEPLMEAVLFNPELGNEWQGYTFEISIEAEAVQTANNGTSGESAVWG